MREHHVKYVGNNHSKSKTATLQRAMTDMIFDYIVCGGGTAGCVVAARLAERTDASILLVEAGRDAGLAPDVEIPGKYVHQLTADPEGLWHLPTVPQKELNDRQLIFLRGKQLGGSSAVNYMALARGPSADYDEWADLVQDDSWRWENVLPLMKELEDFRPIPPAGFEQYAKPDAIHHGQRGPIKIGFGDVMTPGVENFLKACNNTGIPLCLDNNSGNPIGASLAQFNNSNGVRSYAANAYLDASTRQKLSNLKIMTDASILKVRIEDEKAVGVELREETTNVDLFVTCRREVILSAGTFGSPQILMHSGIGPREQLASVGIPCVRDLAGVGQNMLDHSILTVEYRVDDSIPAHNQIFADPKLLADADSQYARDRTGPHSEFGTSGSVAFPRMQRLYQSPEFGELNDYQKSYMLEETRPSAEIWLGSGPSAYTGEILPEHSYMTFELLLQNNLSRGTLALRSNNPSEPPIIDPAFLSHPYDKRIAIETVRQALSIGKSGVYADVIRDMVHGPRGDDDASILEFVRANLGQGYHSLGTCAMGPESNSARVVDVEFKVVGVQGLRVADLSVCPILTCNHTQINAYLIGEKCASTTANCHNTERVASVARL